MTTHFRALSVSLLDGSLLHGWLPAAVQVIAVAVLVGTFGWRSRRWSMRWLPIALLVGVAAAVVTYWYIDYQGWAGDPAPFALWAWIGLTGVALVVVVAGWRGTRLWQRGLSVLLIPLCMLCVALCVNVWTGYLSTVAAAWDRLSGAPLGGQIDTATFLQMQSKGEKPINGTILSVTIPDDASGFAHRDELVYLPPSWYATKPAPALPVVMMIGGEFGHPTDWPRAGATKILDDFAQRHAGNAPVVVWVDQSGAFSNDTECVNGTRGNAADHLTKDVVPYLISNFHVSADPAHWGVAGWSAGGTCALTLTVKYPELFTAFLDIDGQMGPNAGTEQQTIFRLFGGDPEAWAAFDPKTLIMQHGRYQGISGWFAVSGSTTPVYRAGAAKPYDIDIPEPDRSNTEGDNAAVAQYMCALASSYGIECAVVPDSGNHDFQSAVRNFGSALPWLAGKLGTPGVPSVPLPGAPQS